jgi:hypothetical protein
MPDAMRNTLNYHGIGAHCLSMFIATKNDAIKIKESSTLEKRDMQLNLAIVNIQFNVQRRVKVYWAWRGWPN